MLSAETIVTVIGFEFRTESESKSEGHNENSKLGVCRIYTFSLQSEFICRFLTSTSYLRVNLLPYGCHIYLFVRRILVTPNFKCQLEVVGVKVIPVLHSTVDFVPAKDSIQV